MPHGSMVGSTHLLVIFENVARRRPLQHELPIPRDPRPDRRQMVDPDPVLPAAGPDADRSLVARDRRHFPEGAHTNPAQTRAGRLHHTHQLPRGAAGVPPLKQEAIYLEEIQDGFQARKVIRNWMAFYWSAPLSGSVYMLVHGRTLV